MSLFRTPSASSVYAIPPSSAVSDSDDLGFRLDAFPDDAHFQSYDHAFRLLLTKFLRVHSDFVRAGTNKVWTRSKETFNIFQINKLKKSLLL